MRRTIANIGFLLYAMPSSQWIRRTANVFCVVLLASFARAQDPEVVVEVDTSTVYLGESLTYDVTLNHVADPAPPNLDALKDFKVESGGQQSLNSRRISIFNGVKTEVVRNGMLFRYYLTPLKAGEQDIPAPTAEVDGEIISGREVRINVVAPEDQDTVILTAVSDRTSVYPMQPFTVSLEIAVRQLPGEHADRSPLSVQNSPVNLSVPWLEDESLPEGLAPERSWKQILQPLVSRSRDGAGMAINDVGSQSVFSMFGSRKTTFLPPSEVVRKPDANGDPAGYVAYKLSRTFVPERTGDFSFAAARIKGVFATRLTDRLEGESIYAISESLTVTAKEPPIAGRPDSYIGGIGTFAVTADIAPKDATVGQPMTLTIDVRGTGTISELRPPNIESILGLTDSFRTYDPTEETSESGRTFTYSLRPLSESVVSLPQIPVGFFDVESESYVELQTDIIPLTISAAKQLSTSSIVAANDHSTGGTGTGLTVNEAGLFANHSSLQSLRGVGMSTVGWLGTWCSMIAGYLALSYGIRRRQQIQSDPAILRRRHAKGRASESLRRLTESSNSTGGAGSDALSKVIAGLIADFLNCSEAGMTSQDADELLAHVAVDDNLRKKAVDFMERCDAARYGNAAADLKTLQQDCRGLIEELGKELSSR